MTILKIVVTGDGFGDVVTRIQRGSIQRFDEPDLVFVNDRGIEQANCEQPRLYFVATLQRRRLRQNAISTWRKNINLWSTLTAGRDEQFGILKTQVTRNRLGQ